MRKLINFGKPLSINEMRNIMASSKSLSDSAFGSCDRLDCNFQSPSFTCQDGSAPTCASRFCTKSDGTTSTINQFGCGQG